jgi:hypothetical protein
MYQALTQLSDSLYTYRPSSDSSTFLEPVAHKAYTTKARRRDILQAAGEASSEANKLAASNQEALRELQCMLNSTLGKLQTW